MSQTFQQIVALVAFGALLLPINVLTQRGRHWSGTLLRWLSFYLLLAMIVCVAWLLWDWRT
jgi:hypothetical protein